MALFVSLLCIIVGIWLLLQFAPQVYLDLSVDEVDLDRGVLKVTATVQNTSRARLSKQTVLLQGLAYPGDKALKLPDHVPFNTAEVRSGEEPLAWHEPKELFREVLLLFPGEALTTECLVPLPQEADIVHIGLQFNAHTGPIEALVSNVFSLKNRWETTAVHLVTKAR